MSTDDEDLVGGSNRPGSNRAGGVAAKELRAFIERIERLDEDAKAIAEDRKDVFAEAKGRGYDAKIMRMVIKARKQDAAERQEQEAIFELYLHAMGMLPDED